MSDGKKPPEDDKKPPEPIPNETIVISAPDSPPGKPPKLEPKSDSSKKPK